MEKEERNDDAEGEGGRAETELLKMTTKRPTEKAFEGISAHALIRHIDLSKTAHVGEINKEMSVGIL